jgi:RNA polymerase sigma-70 factor (ECF subfamily)
LRFGAVLVGPGDAHDTVIDAFLRTSAKIELGAVREQRAYLFTAVVNTAAMQRRARQRRWQRELQEVVPETTPGEQPDMDVQRAVAALSLAQRAVVYFAYWEDLAEWAIAEQLGVSLGTGVLPGGGQRVPRKRLRPQLGGTNLLQRPVVFRVHGAGS